jgi:hypothetical protein
VDLNLVGGEELWSNRSREPLHPNS